MSAQFGELRAKALMKRLIDAIIKIMDVLENLQYPGSFPNRNN